MKFDKAVRIIGVGQRDGLVAGALGVRTDLHRRGQPDAQTVRRVNVQMSECRDPAVCFHGLRPLRNVTRRKQATCIQRRGEGTRGAGANGRYPGVEPA